MNINQQFATPLLLSRPLHIRVDSLAKSPEYHACTVAPKISTHAIILREEVNKNNYFWHTNCSTSCWRIQGITQPSVPPSKQQSINAWYDTQDNGLRPSPKRIEAGYLLFRSYGNIWNCIATSIPRAQPFILKVWNVIVISRSYVILSQSNVSASPVIIATKHCFRKANRDRMSDVPDWK